MALSLFTYGRGILLLSLLLVVPYIIHDPVFGPAGDTSYGLVLGIIAGVMVLQLMFLGIKKHFWIGLLGSQQGWVHAHNYTGFALLLITLMHAGFQLEANFHGFCLLLLILLIGTGFVGLLSYEFVPSRLNNLAPSLDIKDLRDELRELDNKILALSTKIDSKLNQMTWDLVQNTNYHLDTQPTQNIWHVRRLFRNSMYKAQQAIEDNIGTFKQYQAANSSLMDDYVELLAWRSSKFKKLKQANLLGSLLIGWRKFHRFVSMVFFAALIAHIVVSFQY